MEWRSCWTVIKSEAVELSQQALAIACCFVFTTASAALGQRPGPVRAVTGRPNALSGRITGKLDFLISVIVIAGPVVKSRNARREMALGAALNH